MESLCIISTLQKAFFVEKYKYLEARLKQLFGDKQIQHKQKETFRLELHLSFGPSYEPGFTEKKFFDHKAASFSGRDAARGGPEGSRSCPGVAGRSLWSVQTEGD